MPASFLVKSSAAELLGLISNLVCKLHVPNLARCQVLDKLQVPSERGGTMPRSRMCPAKLLGSMFLVRWTLAVSYVALGSTQNAASLKAALDIDRPAPCEQDLARTWNAKKNMSDKG